ncbi:MAG: tetratricopeptide repeat protein [Pirellulales bacterium]
MTATAISGLGYGLWKFAGLNAELRIANDQLVVGNQGLETARDQADQNRREAVDATHKAQSEKRRSDQTLDFFVDSFQRPDPDADGAKLTVVDMLARAWRELAAAKQMDPITRMALFDAIGKSYHGLGQYADSVKALEAARRVADAGRIPHYDQLSMLSRLGEAYRLAGRNSDSVKLLETVYSSYVERSGEQHSSAMTAANNLAIAYNVSGRSADALKLQQRVRDFRLKTLGPDDPLTLISGGNLAIVYMSQNRKDEATELLEDVYKRQVRVMGLEHSNTMATLNNLAVAYSGVGRTKDAIPLYEQARDIRIEKLGPDHPSTLATMHDLAGCYLKSGRNDTAVVIYEQVLERRKRTLGMSNGNTLNTLSNLGTAFRNVGRIDKALACHRQVFELHIKAPGPEHSQTLASQEELAKSLLAKGDSVQAAQHFANVLRHKLHNAPDHEETIELLRTLSTLYEKIGRFADQAGLLETYWEHCQKEHGRDSLQAARSGAHLASCRIQLDEFAAAESLLREADKIMTAKIPGDWIIARTRSLLGESLAGQKKFAEAEPLLKAACLELAKQRERIPDTLRETTIRKAAQRLEKLYLATDREEEARLLRAAYSKKPSSSAPSDDKPSATDRS